MLSAEARRKVSKILDYCKPLLWAWLAISLLLTFGGDKLFGYGWSNRGELFLALYFVIWATLIVFDKPEKCPLGHTDIGFYYGYWSCRTCYKNKQHQK